MAQLADPGGGGGAGGGAGTAGRSSGSGGGGLGGARGPSAGREVSNLGEGVVEGGRAFAKGLVQGLKGVVARPVEGMERGGFAGFFEGVTKVGGCGVRG